jgi:uncharacterized protein (TIGR03083 family)
MGSPTDVDLQASVAAAFVALADLLDGLPDERWETPSLCAGWRVREVVAHLAMPVRYSPGEFQAELRASDGDFTLLSNRIASRDAALPTSELVSNLRDTTLHRWLPPGGGQIGALTHVVIHSLDITVPLGEHQRSSDDALRAVLDHLTHGGTHVHFGVDFNGVSLRATDMDWSFGSGKPVARPAHELALLACGRDLPSGPIGD